MYVHLHMYVYKYVHRHIDRAIGEVQQCGCWDICPPRSSDSGAFGSAFGLTRYSYMCCFGF